MIATRSVRLTATVATVAAAMTLLAAPARGAGIAGAVGWAPANVAGRLGVSALPAAAGERGIADALPLFRIAADGGGTGS